MPGAREAAAIIRGIHDRVQRLEDSVGTDEGIPRILRSVQDPSTTEAYTDETNAGYGTAWGEEWGNGLLTIRTASPGDWDSDDWDGTMEWG